MAVRDHACAQISGWAFPGSFHELGAAGLALTVGPDGAINRAVNGT
jgi:hypothetical protein